MQAIKHPIGVLHIMDHTADSKLHSDEEYQSSMQSFSTKLNYDKFRGYFGLVNLDLNLLSEKNFLGQYVVYCNDPNLLYFGQNRMICK